MITSGEPVSGREARAVYTPEPVLRHPGRLWVSMWNDLVASRELAWRLLVRNVSAQYRQTALGYVWAFVPPLAMTLVWMMLSSQRVIAVGKTAIPYPAYVLIGTVLWQVFVDALNSPLKLVTSSKQMLARMNFPREALILAGLGEVLFNFLVRLVLLAGVLIYYRIPVPATILLAPVGVFALAGLGLMVGMFLTPIGILFQDIQFGVATLTYLWFFLTPVVYPPPSAGIVYAVVRLNPVTPVLVTTRSWWTGVPVGSLGGFVAVTLGTAVCAVAGWIFYRLAMPHLVSRISA